MTTASPQTPRTVSFGPLPGERAVSRHELLRYAAGELSPARRAEIDALLAGDEGLAAELSELEHDKQAFQAQMPFERFAARHEARARRGVFARLQDGVGRLRLALGGGLVAVGAAAALLVLVDGGAGSDPGRDPGSDPSTESGIRLKGNSHLGLFVRDDKSARVGTDGEQLHPGDQIQFVVKDERLTSMVLLGVDGNGVVTVYEARELKDGTQKGAQPVGTVARPRVLEESLILDDALGPERFFVVYADTDVDTLSREAKRAAQLLAASKADLSSTEHLPLSGMEARQSSIHIVKIGR